MVMEKRYYVAVIADIRDSKNIPDRSLFQERLESVLEKINSGIDYPSITKFIQNPPSFYAGDLSSIKENLEKQKSGMERLYFSEHVLASEFKITLGDEFQGLLTSGLQVMHIIDHIERSMFPSQLRFGVGIGEIHTQIKKHSPFGMDGPAYHIARQMISQLKGAERKTLEPSANIKIGIQDNAWLALFINTILSVMSTIKRAWTESQVRVINTFMQEGMQKQQKTADLLGINQPSVQKALAVSNFYTYRYALEVISFVLGGDWTEEAIPLDLKTKASHTDGSSHV